MRGYVALAAGVACLAFASAASATDLSVPAPINPDRFYVSFHGGYVFSSTSHDVAYDTIAPLGPTGVSDSTSKPGWRLGGAIGKELGDHFAVEGEVAYASAAAGTAIVILPAPGGPLALTGSGSLLTAMLNTYLAANVGSIRPYVGAGVGAGWFTANNITGAGAVLNGSDVGLAAQAIAGIDFAFTESSSIGARYRYLYVADLSLMDGGYKHDFNTTSQSVEVVLTQKLN